MNVLQIINLDHNF